jgi:hypothetical protein
MRCFAVGSALLLVVGCGSVANKSDGGGTGGMTGAGGAVGTGGATSTGGAVGTGGATSTGDAVGAGGSTGTDGAADVAPDSASDVPGTGTDAGAPADAGVDVGSLMIDGLVAYYRGSGVDLTGGGHNANAHGNVTLVADRFGQANLAARFDGDPATYLEVAPDPALPIGASPRTVSVWLQTTHSYPAAPGGGVWNWGTSVAPAGGRFGMLVISNKDYFVGEGMDVAGMTTLNDGKWHNIIVTYDGLTETTYVDNFFSAMGTLSLNTRGQNLEIGRSSVDHPTPEPFFGAIDELRVYSRVLNTAERGQIFAQGGWQ